MFDHLRTHLQAQLADAQAAVDRAIANRVHLQAEVDRLSAQLPAVRDAYAQAQTATITARGAVTQAQSMVDQRQQARNVAQAARDAVQRELADHDAHEPRETIRDKPNPAWKAWNEKRKALRTQLADAQAVLDRANADLAMTQQARDAAVQRANSAAAEEAAALQQVAAAETGVANAQQVVTDASGEVSRAEQSVAPIAEQIAALDGRAARILAEPLDRPDLEHAADAEVGDLLDRRRHRHELLVHRATVAANRAGVLAEQDATIDEAQAIRQAIGTWPDTSKYPSLAGVAAALDAVAAASVEHRRQPASQRTDDLEAVRSVVAAQLDAVRSALRQASAERDGANAALERAAEVLNAHQAIGP